MARTTSFALGDYFSAFIEEQIRQGRYASASEVIRDGLRLLESREKKLQTLRDALIAGEQSGEPENFDFDAFMADMEAEPGA